MCTVMINCKQKSKNVYSPIKIIIFTIYLHIFETIQTMLTTVRFLTGYEHANRYKNIFQLNFKKLQNKPESRVVKKFLADNQNVFRSFLGFTILTAMVIGNKKEAYLRFFHQIEINILLLLLQFLKRPTTLQRKIAIIYPFLF